MVGWLLAVAATAATTNAVAPVTDRDFYNVGTQLLTDKKYAEAEKMFLSALAMQSEAIQPIALFNLGHARYAEGAELLNKGPDAQKVKTQGNALLAEGERVLVNGEAALAENNLEKMISSYIEGRGVQKELKRAEKVVQSAMETYGKTLAKWQRAADDFTGAAELNSADTNAQHNAEVVRQDLAKLIDSLRQMQQMANAMGKQRQDLGKLLSKLKGQIPAPNAPPGSAGEEDDEEEGKEAKPGTLAGKEEKAGSEGQESATPLSPDQAGKILDGISVDGSRRLSMSDKQGTPPKDKNGRNW